MRFVVNRQAALVAQAGLPWGPVAGEDYFEAVTMLRPILSQGAEKPWIASVFNERHGLRHLACLPSPLL